MDAAIDLDLTALQVRLRREVDADIRFDPGSRHLYATDASNYRVIPAGVVLPRTIDALVDTVRLLAGAGMPITMRGGGTSLAGQAIGPGVVVDTSRHLTRILDMDPTSRTATVEPGVVLSSLQQEAAPHGLRFGPDPATSNRAVLGGMLANDSCGAHSLRNGRTSDNTESLEVALTDGTRATAGWLDLAEAADRAMRGDRWGDLVAMLLRLRDDITDEVAARLPTDLPRLVSGMHLDQVCLPDGMHLGRLLVGTEGTCAVTTTATVQLIERPAATALAVLAFPTDVDAARAVPDLLAHGATAIEGLDGLLVDGARRARRPSSALRTLPEGRAWLIVETSGDHRDQATAMASSIVADVDAPGIVVSEAQEQAAVWQVRTDGLGSITYEPGQPQTLAGWEDAAVPVAALPAYLEAFHDLVAEHGLRAGVYGHYGDGCLHTKIGFDHATEQGRATFESFLDAGVDLVVSLGGSLSGEHGDGRGLSAYLDRMFGPVLTDAMGTVKQLFDPTGVMNPGILVDPVSPLADLRTALPLASVQSTLAFHAHGGFAEAADRCVGAGTCRRDDDHGSMCPSYRATGEEQHSTRGRARLLAELLRTAPTMDATDDATAEALELCLSCKACVAECPVDVDMARLKAEFAHQRHDVAGVPRTIASRLLGAFHPLSRLAGWWPELTNLAGDLPPARWVWHRLGFTPSRRLPALAGTSFRAAWRRRGVDRVGTGTDVTLYVDTFTDMFAPDVAAAAVRVLTATGHRVRVETRGCCGRPRFSEGQLDQARGELTTLVDVLAGDEPVVWLEPSCLSVVRDELGELITDERATSLRARSVTLAELATSEDWSLPDIGDGTGPVLLHPHCHHRAVVGDEADRLVLDRLGLSWSDLDAGCCGLAGSFGFVDGDRYDVSMATAADRFQPRLEEAGDAIAVMDGFSCREQTRHLGLPTRTRHLAHLLDHALNHRGPTPESHRPDAQPPGADA